MCCVQPKRVSFAGPGSQVPLTMRRTFSLAEASSFPGADSATDMTLVEPHPRQASLGVALVAFVLFALAQLVGCMFA